jgi:broad specificity phosphatase PhoE
MSASRILLLRHAQKPRQHLDEGGVGEDGRADPESLSVEGWRHAGAIGLLFALPDPALHAFGLARPDVLFVSPPEKRSVGTGRDAHEVGSHSRRPLQTVATLARRLGLKPVADHLRGEEPRLVADALGRPGTVLICWQHEELPAIGRLIAGDQAGVPDEWGEETYDRVWRFTAEGGGWAFADLVLPMAEPAP